MQIAVAVNPVGNQWTSVAALEWLLLSSSTKSSWTLAIQSAEKMLGLPVTSTSVCTVRNMLDLLELEPRIPSCGSLLQ